MTDTPRSDLVDRLSQQLDDPSDIAAQVISYLPGPVAYRLVEALERPDTAQARIDRRLSVERLTVATGQTTAPASQTRLEQDCPTCGRRGTTHPDVKCPTCGLSASDRIKGGQDVELRGGQA